MKYDHLIKISLEKFTNVYMFWLGEAPSVQKALWCRPANEIPYARLKDTTWGKQFKEREGHNYGEN